MSGKRISLCMIVKDEEECLGRCLDSVKALADEMIIVDTGSSDRTVEIAESYGAKIYHHPWQGSFSEARNYGLQFATGDWILQLDADEALEPSDIPAIREAVQSDAYNAIFVALLNDTPEGWAKHYFQRIFRRGKARYEGIVHNQLVFEGKQLNTEIRIYHWGYNLSLKKMREKYKRTEALLARQIEETPQNAFAWQNYLRVLRAQKRYEEVESNGLKALEICGGNLTETNWQMIQYDRVYCLLQRGLYDQAEKLCREVLDRYKTNLDCLYILGSVLIAKQNFQESISYFKDYLRVIEQEKRTPHQSQLIIDTYNFEHRAWASIAEAYFHQQKYDDAERAARQTIRIRPDLAVHKVGLARILVEINRKREAAILLDESARQDTVSIEFFIKWAALAKINKEADQVISILRKGADQFPESEEILIALANEMTSRGSNEAEALWRKALALNPESHQTHIGLFNYYMDNNESESVQRRADILIQTSADFPLIKKAAATCMHKGFHRTAARLFETYLESRSDDIYTLCDLATCYARSGRLDAAITGYEAVLQIDPENTQIRNNYEKILSLARKEHQTETGASRE